MTDAELLTDTELLGAFAAGRDAAAFEALLRRHGPLVLRVCRDVLGDPDEAEDAFQATFLLLVRRVGTIRDPESLGRWLYGVAYRVALRARAEARRRRAKGSREVEMATTTIADDDAERQELRPLVHAELARLPEKLRAPLILCYMEGHSYEEAARRLRVPLGTLKDRLGRGRELLRSRLGRRGVAVTMFVLLSLLSEEAHAVPPGLAASTAVVAHLTVRRPWPLPETVPYRVARLVEAESGVRSVRRWASLVALAVLLGLGSAGLCATRSVWAEPSPLSATPVSSPAWTRGCHTE